MPRPWPEVLRWLGIALVGLLGAWAALLVVGPLTYPVGPFQVEYLLRPGHGRTDIGLPPFGTLSVDTHTGPVHLTATLRSADPDQLGRAVGSDIPTLTAEIERDGLDALRGHALRAMGIALVGAGLGGLLVYRTRWRRAVASAVAGVVLVGGSSGLALLTYRPESFRQPTYSGSLQAAVEILGPIRQAGTRLERFRSEVSLLAGKALAAYEGLGVDGAPTTEAVAVLHVSDLHASPLGMDFTQQVAASFDVDLVVDTGDITSFGTPLETTLIARIAAIDAPYLFVRGNHDSAAVGELIEALPNARVLDGEARTVAGVTVYGAAHPLYTPDPGFDLSHEEIAEAVVSAGRAVAEGVASLEAPPDIVAVHDDRLALAVAGQVPLVVSGHFHSTGHRVIDGTLFLRTGTTGGGGLDTFTSDERAIPLAAQILYFEGSPQQLVAVDRVELDPDTRNLTVERLLADALDGGEPIPGPSPTA
jgi:Calcineurin-like phosphoesterase